jgi:hypothetical protein
MSTSPSSDIHDFLADLSAAGVRFVVVGAYALAAHELRDALAAKLDIVVALNPPLP